MEWANRSTWCEGSRCLRLGIDRRWVPVHRGSISPRALESQRLCKLTRSTVRWLWPNRWVLLRCQVPEPITISQCYPTVIGPLYCDRTSHWLCDCLFQSVRDLNSLSKPSWHFSLSTSPILLLPLRLYFLFLFLRLLLLVALFFGCLSQLSDLGFIDSSPASSISSYPSFLISYPYSPHSNYHAMLFLAFFSGSIFLSFIALPCHHYSSGSFIGLETLLWFLDLSFQFS